MNVQQPLRSEPQVQLRQIVVNNFVKCRRIQEDRQIDDFTKYSPAVGVRTHLAGQDHNISMAETWYVQDEDGTVSGPYLEKQVAQALLSEQITDGMQVRQGNSDWCDAARARSILRQLGESGWYVRVQDEAHGPFIKNHLNVLQ